MSIQTDFNQSAELSSSTAEEIANRILANIEEADRWFKKLGCLGNDFIKVTNQLGLSQEINTAIPSAARYEYYSYPNGFLNKVKYGQKAFDSPASVFYMKTHEIIHALQAHKTPAVHFTPYNPHTNYIICPKDMIVINELAEHDAYAKHSWICSQLEEKQEELEFSLIKSPVRLSDFTETYRENLEYDEDTALNRSLQQAGFFAMNHVFASKNGGTKTLKEEEHNFTIDGYYSVCAYRQKMEPKKLPRIIRLDKEDIAAIGNSFGPNFFLDKNGELLETYSHFPNFDSELNEQKYFRLNEMLGFSDESELPTLTEALEEDGVCKESFIEQSINKPLPFKI
jgi:hypothetical protein